MVRTTGTTGMIAITRKMYLIPIVNYVAAPYCLLYVGRGHHDGVLGRPGNVHSHPVHRGHAQHSDPKAGLLPVQGDCQEPRARGQRVPLLASSHWEVDVEALERLLDAQSAAIIVNNPSNPCGSVYSEGHLLRVLELCRKYPNLTVIADEIYEDMVFNGHTFHPMAKVAHAHHLSMPILTCGGLAKRFLVPGWRLGWILVNRDERLVEIRKALCDMSTLILGANSTVQAALPGIFADTPGAFHLAVNGYVETQSVLLCKRVARIRGLEPITPQGTFYMMVKLDEGRLGPFADDVLFARKLYEEQLVQCLPGSIFSMPGYIRLVAFASAGELEEAMDRVERFVDAVAVGSVAEGEQAKGGAE